MRGRSGACGVSDKQWRQAGRWLVQAGREQKEASHAPDMLRMLFLYSMRARISSAGRQARTRAATRSDRTARGGHAGRTQLALTKLPSHGHVQRAALPSRIPLWLAVCGDVPRMAASRRLGCAQLAGPADLSYPVQPTLRRHLLCSRPLWPQLGQNDTSHSRQVASSRPQADRWVSSHNLPAYRW